MSDYDSALASANLASQAAKRSGTASDHADAARAWAYIAFLDEDSGQRSPFEDTRNFRFMVEIAGFTTEVNAGDAESAVIHAAKNSWLKHEVFDAHVTTVPTNGIRYIMKIRIGDGRSVEVVK